jgi:hypothetical protein
MYSRNRSNDNFINSDNFNFEAFDDDFAAINIEDRNFESLPESKYKTSIEEVYLTRSQNSGNLILKWKLRIVDSQYEGRILWQNNVILPPKHDKYLECLKRLKQNLNICGLRLKVLSNLQKNLYKLINTKIEVTKRTNGDYDNVYFNKRIMIENEVNDYNKTANDDIPF